MPPPSSSSVPPRQDPLQRVLNESEEELQRRLREACEAEAEGLSTKSTQEIRELEDALLAAAVAAEQTITLRRHVKVRAPAERERPITVDEAADRKGDANPKSQSADELVMGSYGEESLTRVREFTDDSGGAWRAWPVIPGHSRASASGRSFLGDFQDGWICFEGLNNTQRRRLPCRQPDWASVTDEELQRLLAQAIDAPGRATKRQEKR
jgi:hypothetical protein